MSTNHTANYSLSQWEPTDQVLRADFNADNAKIDEALFRADRRGLQVIKEIVTTEDTKDLIVRFPEIDWKEWNTVRVLIYSTIKSTHDIDCYIAYDEPVGRVTVHGTQIIFFPSGREDIAIMGVFLGSTSAAFAFGGTRFKGYSTITLKTSTTGNIGNGTRFVFLGEHI